MTQILKLRQFKVSRLMHSREQNLNTVKRMP